MKPSWIKIKIPMGEKYVKVKDILRKYALHTVCEEAKCPNLGECWSKGTATFMILGDVCTRRCKFCAVKTGNPKGIVDKDEPDRVAKAVKELNLRYVVITSVDRDDLPDGGAEVFANTVIAVRRENPDARVECLIPDFKGDVNALKRLTDTLPEVIGHNLETVERLTPFIRDRRAGYRTSLEVLGNVKRLNDKIVTKSGIMLGLGEEREEILKTMEDLREADVDILTLGQYLQPTAKHLSVKRYVSPEEFDEYKRIGMKMGFKAIVAGPFVRSSYRAEETFSAVVNYAN